MPYSEVSSDLHELSAAETARRYAVKPDFLFSALFLSRQIKSGLLKLLGSFDRAPSSLWATHGAIDSSLYSIACIVGGFFSSKTTIDRTQRMDEKSGLISVATWHKYLFSSRGLNFYFIHPGEEIKSIFLPLYNAYITKHHPLFLSGMKLEIGAEISKQEEEKMVPFFPHSSVDP